MPHGCHARGSEEIWVIPDHLILLDDDTEASPATGHSGAGDRKDGMASIPSARAVAADPLWFPHRFEPTDDVVQFRHLERETHRAATFLTDIHLGEDKDIAVVGREAAIAAAGPAAPLHFIFHSAFCCSTLLARAFDVEGVAMGLKEPVILNDLSGWKHRGGDPRLVARALDGAMRLLERPFATGEAVIVKPSNVINALSVAMLAMRPDARALLLYAPLRVYLGSVAKKGLEGRLWVRDLLVKQLKDGMIHLGFSEEDYLRHTDLQAAAVGWLAQHALFADLVRRYGSQRVRSIDSDTLMARPVESIAALARLYDLNVGADFAETVVAGPAFNSHSKSGESFDRAARAVENKDAASIHADEIEKVVVWAEAVAKNAGVALDPGAPLLD